MPVRIVIATLAAVMGTVLSVRLLYGPYSVAGISVNTALNPAGVFGLLVTLLMVTALPNERPRQVGAFRWMWAGVAGIAAAGFAAGIRVGFLSDDFALLALTADWSPATFLRDLRTSGGDGFWRPLGFVSLGLNQAAVGRDPLLWHLITLALHTANAILVGVLALRLGAGRIAAFFAAALFAIHGGRPESAVWIASRFDLQATFLALLAALLYERARYAWGIAAFVLAAMSKEAVYVLPAVLVCLSLYWKRSWRPTIPYFAAAALLFAYRWTLFRGIGGYRVAGEAQFYSFNPTTVKTLLVRLWTGLYLPVNWAAEPSIWLGLAAVLYLGATLYLGWRARPARSLWPIPLALLVAVFPALHLLSAGVDLEGQRLFYFPSVFFCLMLALALDGTAARLQPAIAAAVLIFHFGALQHNLAQWRYASARVDAACREAAQYPIVHITGLPRTIHGAHAFVHGVEECIEMAAGHAVSVTTEGDAPAGAVHLEWDASSGEVRPAGP